MTQSISSTLNHVAVIADGNRRWAKQNNLPPSEGHKRGFIHTTPQIIENFWNLGVHTVTIWGFSTKNWNRSNSEVTNVMNCFNELLTKMLPIAKKNKGKIFHLGRKDRLPKDLLDTLSFVEKETSYFKEHIFNLAIDFGGRDEIIRACRKLSLSTGSLEDITEENIDAHLDTAAQPFPSPDLIIRPSGELRLSGFMSWQALYSELYFTKKYYPELTHKDLEEAIESFKKRDRTFSK